MSLQSFNAIDIIIGSECRNLNSFVLGTPGEGRKFWPSKTRIIEPTENALQSTFPSLTQHDNNILKHHEHKPPV